MTTDPPNLRLVLEYRTPQPRAAGTHPVAAAARFIGIQLPLAGIFAVAEWAEPDRHTVAILVIFSGLMTGGFCLFLLGHRTHRWGNRAVLIERRRRTIMLLGLATLGSAEAADNAKDWLGKGRLNSMPVLLTVYLVLAYISGWIAFRVAD